MTVVLRFDLLRLGEVVVRLDFVDFRQRPDAESDQVADAGGRLQPQGVRPQRAVARQGQAGLDPLVGQDLQGFDGDARLIEQQATGVAKALAGEDHFDFRAALAAAGQELVDFGYGSGKQLRRRVAVWPIKRVEAFECRSPA